MSLSEAFFSNSNSQLLFGTLRQDIQKRFQFDIGPDSYCQGLLGEVMKTIFSRLGDKANIQLPDLNKQSIVTYAPQFYQYLQSKIQGLGHKANIGSRPSQPPSLPHYQDTRPQVMLKQDQQNRNVLSEYDRRVEGRTQDHKPPSVPNFAEPEASIEEQQQETMRLFKEMSTRRSREREIVDKNAPSSPSHVGSDNPPKVQDSRILTDSEHGQPDRLQVEAEFHQRFENNLADPKQLHQVQQTQLEEQKKEMENPLAQQVTTSNHLVQDTASDFYPPSKDPRIKIEEQMFVDKINYLEFSSQDRDWADIHEKYFRYHFPVLFVPTPDRWVSMPMFENNPTQPATEEDASGGRRGCPRGAS